MSNLCIGNNISHCRKSREFPNDIKIQPLEQQKVVWYTICRWSTLQHAVSRQYIILIQMTRRKLNCYLHSLSEHRS